MYTKHHNYCGDWLHFATFMFLPVRLSVPVPAAAWASEARGERGGVGPASGEKCSSVLTPQSNLSHSDLELTAVVCCPWPILQRKQKKKKHFSLHVYVRGVVLVFPTDLQVDRTADVSSDNWLHGMKNTSISLHLFIARQEIFLRRRPLETRRSHARRPAATLPTRFSIKQANNTIPTPINK